MKLSCTPPTRQMRSELTLLAAAALVAVCPPALALSLGPAPLPAPGPAPLAAPSAAGQVPAASALAAPGACEALGPCELFAELQEHSRRIAGFSYNVKKADVALTTLARQQALAADRAQRLAMTLRDIERGLDGARSGGGNASEGAEGGEGGVPGGLLLPAAPTAAPDWEKAAARELARLGDRLTRLREQVNTSFIRTLQENSEELGHLRGRVASLHVQVVDLEAAVRGENSGRRVSADGDSPSQSPLGTTASPPTTPVAATPSIETNATIATTVRDVESPNNRNLTINATTATGHVENRTMNETHANGNETVRVLSINPNATSIPSNSTLTDELSESKSSPEVNAQVTPSTVDETHDSVNGHGNGNGNGNGETVDLLGIELETVRTAFDTLHAQVTELQARCDTRGDELERLVASLEQRLATLETTQPGNATHPNSAASTVATEVESSSAASNASSAPDKLSPAAPSSSPATESISPTTIVVPVDASKSSLLAANEEVVSAQTESPSAGISSDAPPVQ